MKYLMSIFLLVSSSVSTASTYFAEFDVLNPVFRIIETSHSLRNDFRFGQDHEEWQWAVRYAHELGVPADTVGASVKGKDGDAHHLALRASYKIYDKLHFGGGYIYSLFKAESEFNGREKTLNTSTSGVEAFMNYRWDFTNLFVKSEVSYHHIFSNLKIRGQGGYSEYDIGQGKISLLIGRDF